MSAMRKMGVYLGLLEDADGDYAEPDNEYDEPARRTEPPRRARARTPRGQPRRASPPGA